MLAQCFELCMAELQLVLHSVMSGFAGDVRWHDRERYRGHKGTRAQEHLALASCRAKAIAGQQAVVAWGAEAAWLVAERRAAHSRDWRILKRGSPVVVPVSGVGVLVQARNASHRHGLRAEFGVDTPHTRHVTGLAHSQGDTECTRYQVKYPVPSLHCSSCQVAASTCQTAWSSCAVKLDAQMHSTDEACG